MLTLLIVSALLTTNVSALKREDLGFLSTNIDHVLRSYSSLSSDTKRAADLAAKVGQNVLLDERKAYEKFFVHILEFNKTYNTDAEVKFRFNVIKEAFKKIDKYQKANPEAQYGLTHLSDMTDGEFYRFYANLNHKQLPTYFRSDRSSNTVPTNFKAPSRLDYREQGKVTKVKDQGRCGSSYAFAAVAVIESLYAIHRNHTPIDLSVQQAISCTIGNRYNHGCLGGHPAAIFRYFEGNGITSWDNFPYNASGPPIPPCLTDLPVVTQLSGSKPVEENENKMLENLALNGPIVSTINADPLIHYRGGIVHGVEGGRNHAVMIVGYGEEEEDHWIVKNSWGEVWGEKGYFRVGRGHNDLRISEDNYAAYIDD
ncbi:unnamed protein product [Bursaphelenchus okinawaensis]|uniref:Uncharacterized protein n=1 Tax=Bursaphelenchus okinawaensis TaxID=465554 RepID=A0A811KLS0_9BILA|nr:unnamed protein product [Bursaphelenchus okinawaensis]CAG9107213.1 unnamed protein product [Bursaphelenchus okinawaensis]